MRLFLVLLGCSCCAVWAQSDKPNLSGTWQLDSAKSEIHSGKSGNLVWQIDEKPDTLAITLTEKDADGHDGKGALNCQIGGKNCTFKDSEGSESASFWYNGPLLVEMKTTGHSEKITKYKMKLSADGKTLDVDVAGLVPASTQPDHLVFVKQ